MKIGFIVPGGVDRTGTHRVVPHLVERLRRLSANHEVHVFALRQEPRPGRWTLEGAVIHNVGAQPRRLRCLSQIAAEHRRGPFDVLHAMFLVPQGVVAGIAGRLLRVPVVAEAPGGDFVSLPEISFGGFHSWRGGMWVRWAAAMASRVLVPSEFVRRAAEGRGVPAEVMPWGTGAEIWSPVAPVRRNESGPLRVLWVGSINAVKDPWTMLDVSERLLNSDVDVVIDVLGEDTLAGRVHDAARTRGLGGRVRFLGYLPQQELRQRMLNAHVLLSTSRFEAGPRVVLEAAATGIPTVGTSVGYLTELAPHGAIATGIGDAAALAEGLQSLSRDEAARVAMSEVAQRWAAVRDCDAVTERLETLYREVARRPSEAHAAAGSPG